MKTFSGNRVSRLFALLAALVLGLAQGSAHAQAAYVFSQQELDQMLAPIALYPDALLSQILMASTYPLEVVEAARWSRARPGLSGDDAVRAAEGEYWDPSVKSLLAFPQVLARMDENLPWMHALGDAFLDQPAQLMDTVQVLRRRAEAAGNLRSDERLRVLDSNSGLMLEPLDAQVVYVPDYDPMVVYGSWWWPAYPPVYFRPWPGYYARPGYTKGYYWGPPVGISAGFFFGAFDWPRRQVRVVQVNNYYYSHSVVVDRSMRAHRAPGAWQHEPEHRRGIAYRGLETQQRFGAAGAPQRFDHGARPAETRRADERRDVRPAARPETRLEPRSDLSRPAARPAAETRARVQAAQPAPVMQATPADTRIDHRRESRGATQFAQPAPVRLAPPPARPAPAAPPAPVAHPAPAALPAPAAQAAAPAHGNHQAERHEPGARHESPQPATRQDNGADPMGRPRTGR